MKLLILVIMGVLASSAAFSETRKPERTVLDTERPMIWVVAADRAAILAKIDSQPWTKTAFEAMKGRVADAVARHKQDPDAFLRGLPLVEDQGSPPSHPHFARTKGNMAGNSTGSKSDQLQGFLQTGIDCAVLHYLTRNEDYARCAADILHVCVEALVQMKASDEITNGGWLYPDDHLYEARAIGAQIPLIYDFVANYLRSGGMVYDLALKRPTPFNFENAQQVFRTYARLAIEHGSISTNWPVLEMPSLAHNALALDDPTEREKAMAHVTHLNTRRQDSLEKIITKFAKSGAIWPESLVYSRNVSQLTTYLVALLQRQTPALALPPGYQNIPLSLARIRDFRFPNGDAIRFGDGPRRLSEGYDSYEISYSQAMRSGDLKLQSAIGPLLNQPEYRRFTPRGHVSGPNIYLGPLQLLWFAPEIPKSISQPAPRTTDELPFAGVVLQRNPSPDKDPKHALMAVVSGGSHVHSHASGMSLELYGAGHILGTPAGSGTYTTAEHENYRRLFAAHNCVIVNGASRSNGGWANLRINTVEKIALEPAVGAKAVSPDHSFTLTGFLDDKGPGAKAKQERLTGIVRTSATSGYYVDVFRSVSELPDQYHDYLYHNIGDSISLSTAEGSLPLNDTPRRFVPTSGTTWKQNESYLFPGWHFFEKTQTSSDFAQDVMVRFNAAKLKPMATGMRLFIPGSKGREYSRALSPATKSAPSPYDKKPTPVLIIRQHGEAWKRPFAVIYQPFTEADDSSAIRKVTALTNHGDFAGFQVESGITGRLITDYILVQPTATSDLELPSLGIFFRGRYAVVRVNDQGRCTSLYVGEGSRLRFRDLELTTDAAAWADLAGINPAINTSGTANLQMPDDRRFQSSNRANSITR